MHTRNRFRPAALEGLEVRVVLSLGSSLLDPFHLFHSLDNAIDGTKAPAGSKVTVGALGDSYTDEYKFYPPDQSHARNWVEILSATHRVNFGAFSNKSRGEPRDQGFAFNWARNGATSEDMIQNQLPGLTAQVAKGQVKYVWIFIGGNDFNYFLEDAALGKITPDQAFATLAQTEAQAATNFVTAVNTIEAANPHVKLVVSTLPDVTLLPIIRDNLTTPQAQALGNAVSAAIGQYNAAIEARAAGDTRIALVDLAAQSAQLAGAPGGQLPYGGTTINLTTPGDNYHDFFVGDGIHVGTVVQGVIADDFVNAINTNFGTKVPPLSPTQIVRFARNVSRSTP